MKLPTLRAIGAALVLLLLLAGCAAVEISYPLSVQSKPMDKDKFEGTWLMENTTVHVRFACNGVAKLAAVGWEEDQFVLVHGEMIVTDKFISFRGEEKGKWMTNYVLLQYKFTDEGYLLLWMSSQEAFAAAIENNLLSGVVERSLFLGKPRISGITITSPPDHLLKFLNDPERKDLFDYNDPLVLRKIASPEKNGQAPCGDFSKDFKAPISDPESDPDPHSDSGQADSSGITPAPPSTE